MIKKGQIYRNLTAPHTRIKVTAEPSGGHYNRWTYGKAMVVTLTPDGREVRPRAIEATQLHSTATTRDGQPRRTGYVLEEGQ